MFIGTKHELVVLVPVCLMFTYGKKLIRMLFIDDGGKPSKK